LPLVNLICFGPLVLATMAWDWWSSGRVQKVTIWSTVFLLTVQEARHLIGYTAGWQRLAAWVELLVVRQNKIRRYAASSTSP
jgi:hypothetical protein